VERPSPEQLERYRAMTQAERLRQAERLYWSARRLREAHERTLHPDWTDEQIRDRVRRIFLRAGT
jgi:predicted phosphoadenosine phosphosulfate sulfurtransferase